MRARHYRCTSATSPPRKPIIPLPIGSLKDEADGLSPNHNRESKAIWSGLQRRRSEGNATQGQRRWIGLDPLAHHYTYTPQSPLSHSNSSAVISFGGLIMAFALPAVPIAAFPTSFSFSSTHRKISRKCADGKEINAVQGKREKSSMPFLNARFTPLV